MSGPDFFLSYLAEKMISMHCMHWVRIVAHPLQGHLPACGITHGQKRCSLLITMEISKESLSTDVGFQDRPLNLEENVTVRACLQH